MIRGIDALRKLVTKAFIAASTAVAIPLAALYTGPKKIFIKKFMPWLFSVNAKLPIMLQLEKPNIRLNKPFDQ